MSDLQQLRPTRAGLEALFWRSLWTAVQTGTAVAGAAGFGWIDTDAWGILGVSVVGAVLSVVKNYSSQKLGTGGA